MFTTSNAIYLSKLMHRGTASTRTHRIGPLEIHSGKSQSNR